MGCSVFVTEWKLLRDFSDHELQSVVFASSMTHILAVLALIVLIGILARSL